MSMIFFTYRSRLQARVGAERLEAAGLPVRLDKTPAFLAVNGCGYGLWVSRKDGKAAYGVLRQEKPGFTRCFLVEGNRAREVRP